MQWWELRIPVGREAVDLVAHHLVWLGSGGVVIEEGNPGEGGPPPGAGWTTVVAYFPADRRYARRERCLREVAVRLAGEGWPVDPMGISTRAVVEEDWARAWQAFFRSTRVGRRLVVVPEWERHRPEGEFIPIFIDPGMAFGTGTHPTTVMCLCLLEEYLRGGEQVVDVGTGSGILAIAAARLGASHVLALDIDPLAVEIARQNVARNGVDGVVEVRPAGPGAFPLPGADLVVANIVASTIILISPRVAAALRPGGRFIASGIVRGRRDEVERAMADAGLRVSGEREEGEWVSLVATKG